MSPTQKSLKYARKLGYTAQVVEKWIPQARVRKDLWGGIDILMMNGEEIIGVQSTSASNHSARLKKCRAIPELTMWIESGGKFLVWSWEKGGREPRVSRAYLYGTGIEFQ